MPHQFKAHPGHPAVDYLVRLHVDLGGRIKTAEAERVRLATDMQHVEAVLKMFDPEYNVRAIAARASRRRIRGSSVAPCSGKPWALRNATAPMTVTEIAHAVLAANNLTEVATRKRRLGIERGIRATLEDHAGKGTVERIGEGVPKRWKLREV
jgi:hypothetical protein